MTVEEFIESWEKNVWPYEPEFIRKGQSLMNYLGRVWFMEYQRISSPDYYEVDYSDSIDCFYNNDLVPKTIEHLKKVWDNYPD